MKHLLRFALLSALLLLVACNDREKSSFANREALYEPRYATGFRILSYDGNSSILQVINPWQGAQGVVKNIFLARIGEPAPTPFDGVVVKVPATRLVCMSSSYVAFLDALDQTDAVVGVSGAGFITNPRIRERTATGMIADVGFDTNLDFEQIASLKPDAVLLFGVTDENEPIANKLNELGIPSIYIGDYMEYDPLGKAEWLVAVGEICGEREKAQSRFDSIAAAYEAYKQRAATVARRPEVMLNAPFRDVWFVPGDSSYMVRLLEDAGGNYVCRGEPSRISRPISGETAFLATQKADYWLNPNQFTSLEELIRENPRYAAVLAIKNGRVWNNNKITTPEGGSDFWESGVVRADLVLRDLIAILHPELDIADSLIYYRPLH